MDYTNALNNVLIDGKRQFADRDRLNGVPGTTMTAQDANDIVNSIMYAQEQAGVAAVTGDKTGLMLAIKRLSLVAPYNAAIADSYALNSLVSDAQTLGLFWYSTTANNKTVPGTAGANWRAIVLDSSLLAWTQAGTSQYLTRPIWARYLEVKLIGAGGGGAGCAGTSRSQTVFGAGAGSGAVLHSLHDVSTAASIALYVGAGGLGGQGATSGGNGGDTYLVIDEKTVATAGGGKGGNTYGDGGSAGGDGGENSFVSGILCGNFHGSVGGDGQSGDVNFSGNGASGYLGMGAGRAGFSAGGNGSSPGAGAGGAYDASMSGKSYAGGTGYDGACLFRWLP